MNRYKRTHTCGELNTSHINQKVFLCGWMHRRRDFGGLIFVDIRDKKGITQLIFDPERSKKNYAIASQLKAEFVLYIEGTVVARQEGMENANLSTGQIEISVDNITVLSPSAVLPFTLHEDLNLQEELKAKYRYLDIRKGLILKNLELRHKTMLETRNFLSKHAFIEVQTPILGKSTPEGARDYLVPSRIFPGNFYALPQSPQLFKQLLMVAGLDRYFQISPCFRDEDLRADRQPEFYQIDVEMSFSYQEDLFSYMENLMVHLFQSTIHVDIPTPFQQLTYAECIEKYGTDKPDLRYAMPLIRIDDIIRDSTFSLLKTQIEEGASAKALVVKKGADLSRKQIEKLMDITKTFSLPGLAWMKRQNNSFSSSIVKFFSEKQLDELKKRLETEEEDLILIGCAKEDILNQSLDHLRRHLAKTRNLMEKEFSFLWVVDFPLFKKDEQTNKYDSEHHPFTHPHFADIDLIEKDPLKVRSASYDLVVNGYELGSGSQRIHNPDLQQKIFNVLGLSQEEIQTKFGFFVDAMKYGAPPHIGIALGLERLMMILCKTENIRDVVAFPKTTKASDLMMQAPSTVDSHQLKELQIQVHTEQISWS
jgi:aspartyl-tRNA synthetase